MRKRRVRGPRSATPMARVALAGVLFVIVAFTAGSCVQSPGTTSPDDVYESPLAETFDALSRAAGEKGDLARSDGFAYAALSVRSGVTPSRLDVHVEDSIETYDAFVNTAWWDPALPTNVRPPARRTLVGWRKTDAGTTRILALTSPSDSARILSPVALGPGVSTVAVYAAGSAMQNEGRDTPQGKPDIGSAWYGTSGWVKIAEAAVLGTCPDTVRHHDVLGVSHCELARYRVAFDISMQHLAGRPPQLAGTAVRRVSSVEERLVNGLRLRFVCAAPSGEHGCR